MTNFSIFESNLSVDILVETLKGLILKILSKRGMIRYF